MKSHSTITMKQSESPKEVACSYLTAPSSIHKLFTENSSSEKIYDNISLACSTPSSQKIHDNFSSACSTLYIQTESLSSPTPQQGLPLPFFPVKLNLNLKPNSPVSCFSNSQYSEPMVPRSTFCTSLYMSSSKSSEAHRQPCNLPFLPHPSTCDRLGSSVHSSNSPLLLSGDINDQCNEGECSEDITKDFLNLPLDASDSSFHGENYASNSLSFTEQLELQILSEQLDIAITDTGENPGLGEIFDMPQISSTHKTDSKCNENHVHLVPPIDTQTRSSPSDSRTAAVHKPRLRWTLELHERFIEAINKLDEAEKATPKGILKLMNVEGLTIYHVKSHLQKYRLAKYLPEAKEDKGSSSGEKKGASIRNERESGIKRGMQVTEALRLQMEVQKQLHEQLEVQRALQLRIEEQAMYLQKILEHQNASNPFIPSLNLEPSSESQLNSPNNASSQQAESTSSLPLKKHKSTGSDSMDCDLPEYRKQTRVEAKEEITSDSLSIEDQMSALASSPLI